MPTYGFANRETAEKLRRIAGETTVRRMTQHRRDRPYPIDATEEITVVTAFQLTATALQYKTRLVRVTPVEDESDWIDIDSEECTTPTP